MKRYKNEDGVPYVKTTFSIWEDQYKELKKLGGNMVDGGAGVSFHVRKAIDKYLHPEVKKTFRMSIKESELKEELKGGDAK